MSGLDIESGSHEWVFGPFRLLPMQKLLLEGDVPVRLGSRALDILTILVEQAGEVVTKEQLIARVWPTTFVDNANLRIHISALRKLLGDGRGGHRYIVNVTARGYCFVAPVSRTSAAASPATPTAVPMASERVASLPVPLTRVIGRDVFVATVVEQVPKLRLVTVVGPGGVGKTTVAIAAAQELGTTFRDGIHFVDLAVLADPSLVTGAIAALLGLPVFSDDQLASLVLHLRDKHVLLILDSCEHLVEPTAVLAERLLRDAPRLHILATSREPLRAEGERVHRLSPLHTPPAGQRPSAAEALVFPAVQLFLERSAGGPQALELTDADAPTVADICRRLDGIPLAIELAAAQANVFGLPALAAILNDRFRLLLRGRRTALERHRTLGAMLNWSYELLPEPERLVLMRLSLFAGSFTLEAANFVAAHTDVNELAVIDSIATLAEKSLVSADVTGTSVRYRLLDTTRAFARERLTESDTFMVFGRRHAEYHVSLLERAGVEYDTLPAADWCDLYAREIDNVRAALDWAFAPGGDAAIGVALTVAAVPLWLNLSLVHECARSVERAIAWLRSHPDHCLLQDMRLHAALATARVVTEVAVPETQNAWARVLEISRKLQNSKYRLQALQGLWVIAHIRSEFREARRLAEEFHCEAAREANVLALQHSDRMIGLTLHYCGDHAGARRHLESALDREAGAIEQPPISGNHVDPRVSARTMLAQTLWVQGYPDQARQMAETSVAVAQRSRNAIVLCFALMWGAIPVGHLNGDLAVVEEAVTTLLQISERHGIVLYRTWCRCAEATVLIMRGDLLEGIASMREALGELRERRLTLSFSARLGDLAQALGAVARVAEGLTAVDEALQFSNSTEDHWYTPELLRIKAELVLMADRCEAVRAAEALFAESLDWARRQGALSWELRTSVGLARLLRREGRPADAHRLLTPVYERFTEGFDTMDLAAARIFLNEGVSAAGVRHQ